MSIINIEQSEGIKTITLKQVCTNRHNTGLSDAIWCNKYKTWCTKIHNCNFKTKTTIMGTKKEKK